MEDIGDGRERKTKIGRRWEREGAAKQPAGPGPNYKGNVLPLRLFDVNLFEVIV